MAAGSSSLEIVKPRTDRRQYRRILLPNSLEVLLISDPETDKAAASMDVGVGYFSDPDGLEGLAHFLEHMLFYASEKYPVEDSYSKYISEHGGSTNAFTSSEHTNFYFDINADCLDEALDRFAQFFVSPLMSPDATLREIKAVDSEHQKNLLSDAWRMSQLEKHLSSKDHPYHKFSTGSWDTLETKPKAKGVDIRKELLKFYEENYSASLMHLVVYGKECLDEIQSLVESKFKNIRNIGRSNFHFVGQPCSREHLQIFVKAVPIKQGHTLRILWPVNPNIRHYKEGPCRYLSHLIGHEGEGSVFHILKKLGWAISLCAGEADGTYECSFFSVVIELTDAGQEHVEDIVGLLFKYINLLRTTGITKWIFNELMAICETKFHYQDKIPPRDYVVSIATNMKLYPPEDWLVASSLPTKFAPSIIEMVLNELNPENVRIFWESKKFEGCTNSTEPWYRTSYSVERITSSIIQQWTRKTPIEDLHLPTPNKFIPTDLALKHVTEKVSYPFMLRKSSFSRLWYKPDTMFCTPKGYIRIDFHCPHSNYSPEADVLTEIFTKLVTDYLNEYAYDAQVAGLYYGILQTDAGFQVIVIGYNHKMRILLETIIAKIKNFEVKPDRFSVIKEAMTKEYQNLKYQQPYQQALYYCSLLLEEHAWPWSEELEILPHLEVHHLSNFWPQILSGMFLECYVAGNIEASEADSVAQHIEDVFFNSPHPICKPLYPSQYMANRIVKLEKGVKYYYPAEGLNQSDENSAIVHYIQVHQDDIKLNVELQLFALIAKQPAFHQLRSVEQLGYITVLMQRNDFGVRGIQLIIQSTAKDPAQLDSRVESFYEMIQNKLHEMTEEEYKDKVRNLIDLKLEKHKNLREESAFFWREIEDGTLRFDRIAAEVTALRDLKREELLKFFDDHVKIDAPLRKTLSVQVYGGLHSMEFKQVLNESSKPQTCRIKDVFSFRRSRPLYGSFKGGLGQMKL